MALPAHNLFQNPSGSVAATGWSGTASVVRVTGLTGAPRTTGLQATANGYFRSAVAAVTPGQEYTVSFYGNLTGPGATGALGTTYWVWYDSGMADLSYPNWGSWPGGGGDTWYRHSATATAPTGAAYLGIIQDVGTYGPVLTAVLVEEGAVTSDYADGDTSGWAWDGTTGLSSSQPASSSVSGTIAAPLGGLTAHVTGTHTAVGTVSCALGGLTAHVTGVHTALGTVAASLGGLTAHVTGTRSTPGTIACTLGGLTASVFSASAHTGTITVSLGALTVTLQQQTAPPIETGSWGPLLALVREARTAPRIVPTEAACCPNDGFTLLPDPRGGLRCPFDGWTGTAAQAVPRGGRSDADPYYAPYSDGY